MLGMSWALSLTSSGSQSSPLPFGLEAIEHLLREAPDELEGMELWLQRRVRVELEPL